MAAGPALPYANNLTFDETLSFSDDNYREKLENGIEMERRSKEERMASVIEYPEARVFARFAVAAYQDWRKEGESQSDYEKRLRLPEGWKLLTSARGLALKGAIYGYFGSAFWQPEHRRVVIAHRGTIPTNLNAVWADVMGILGHSYVKQMSAACTFAHKIRDAVEKVERERQTTFDIFFTGHSLGAWLAQVTTFSLKYLTLVEGAFVKNVLDDGYHARTVVFDSPGCEDTIRKMIKDLDVRYSGKSTSAASLDVTTFLSSPNFVNCCNRHIGKLYRLYPQIDREGYVKYTWSSHSMKGLLETFVLWARPKLKEVVDWPQIQVDLWQLKPWTLPEKILGKEYQDFFQFAKDLNDYDPSAEDIKVDFESAATDNDNAVRFVRVRYQTKPARTDECASNVFTDSELQFLQRFQQLKIIPNSLFEGEEMSEENQAQIAEYLNNLVINAKDNSISLREESQLKIFQIIPYVKTLLQLYPRLKERARQALTDFEVRKQIYADITKEYRRKMEYLTAVLSQSEWPELDRFLVNDSSICHVLAQCGTDSAMAKVLRVIEIKDLTVLAFELQNLVTTETFFHLTEFLKSDSLIGVFLLIAIECKAGTLRNRENSRLVRKVLEEIEDGRSKAKLIIITDTEDEINLDDDWVRVSHGGITWDELTNPARAEITSKKLITFQGNSEKNSLKNLISSLSDLPEILDPETLVKFLKGEDVLVGHKIPALADFYVPRKFKYNPYVKEEIFDNARDDDVVAVWANDQRSFSTITTKLEGHWKKRRFQIIKSDEDYKFLCENNSGRKSKNIHCLKMLESNLLVWRKTKGSLNLIRKHIRDSAPGTVLGSIEDVTSKTLIISDAPGMGKSTVLSVLARKLKERTPNRWVIRINLNDCAKALNDAKNNNTRLNNLLDAAKFLSGQILSCSENTDLKSDFERKLFEKSLTSSGGMVLVLDAFDEISPDYEEMVLQLVKLLNESRLEKLVLSTRPHTKEQLEDQLETLSYTMVPFSRDDQKEFLKQFWIKRLNEEDEGQIDSDDLANQCVDQLKESISAEEGDFLGIPLQCELLAEYTLDKIVSGENQLETKKISLMELYETFVRKKMDIYQEEKNSKSDGKIGSKFDKSLAGSVILKAHRQYALRLLLSREKWDELDYPEIEENQEQIDTAVQKAGLMLKTGDNPQFVHRTFAEFFVFDYILNLARNTTKKASLKLTILSREVLLQPEFGVARTFLDGLIRDEKNVEETTAILKSFVQIVDQNWTDNKTLCLSRQGFTVLHQLLLGKNFIVLDAFFKMLTDVCGPEIVKDLIDTPEPRSIVPLHIAAAYSHREIARLLLEEGANIDACMHDDTTPLFIASENGHLEVVRLLLEKGANIDACTNDDETPLFIASQNGHLEVVRLLLEKGANIDACTNDDETPLFVASRNGHLEVARLLLEKGAKIDACKNDDATPLFVASQNGHLEVVRLLLEKGAKIDACMNDDATPLFIASQNGHLEVVRLLLEKGAKIDACTNDDETPLFVASQNGHLEVARLLLEKGAKIDACKNDDATPLFVASQNGHLEVARLLLEKGAKIDACTNDDETPLFIASENGHLEVARLLLEKGAKIDACTNDDATPLFVASQNGHLEVVRLLLEKGAKIDACMNDDATPLFIASQNGHLEVARLLLEKGAKIDACKNDDATPLFVASQNGHLEVARLLLEKGAKIDACTNDDETPLFIASENGHLEVARLLLEKGAKIDACTNDDTTPLFVASQNGHLEVVRLLLEKGAKIDACMNDDATPLFIASQNGHLEVARLLLEKGAKIDACKNDDATPLFVASQNGHLEVARLLLEKGAKIDACTNDDETPLFIASENGHLEVARLLLEKGAKIDACTNDDTTPLFVASQNGHLEVVRLLLEKGAKIDACMNDDATPLFIASQNGHLEVVRLLLEKGAKIDACTNDDETPLFIASENGHLEVARLLLEKGAKIDACTNDDETPLFIASENGHLEVARLLLEKGAKIDACTNDDETPLFIASENGHLEVARLLLEKGAKIDACTNDDETPLFVASQNGHLEVVRLLLEKGAKIDACTNDDETPLFVASQNGHLEVVRLLLEKGANIDACRNDDATPLFITSQNGHLEVVRLLLEKGAKIDACTNDDETPLFVASQNGHLEVVRLLLEKGAKIDACTNDDETPLFVASQNGHLEVVRLLLEKGANIDACRNDDATPLFITSQNGHLEVVRLLLEKGAKIDACTNDDETPLFIASENGHLEVARLLLEKGAKIDACTNDDETPLFIASENGHLEVARLLLEKGAKIDACTNDDETPLFVASQNGHLEVVRLLLEKGANIDACRNDDATPLFITSQNGHLEVVRLLLEKGAKIDACLNDDATPLFIASQNGHLEVVRLLLEKGAKIDACRNDDATPLFVASRNGHLEVVRLLLEKGANIDACKNDDATPLFIASQNGHLEVARLLLEKGAKIDACTNNDETPLFIASQNGHLEVARLLLEKGANINARVDNGWTSLHTASCKGQLEIVKLLIDRSAEVDLQDYDGTTALHVVSYHGQLGVANFLVQNGHSVNVAEFFGPTPLHSAAGQGQSDLVIFLLENGANIDAVTINDPPVGHEETPLHHAALEGRTDTVRLLVQRGANVLARNSHDQTPLDLAIIHSHSEIIQILSSPRQRKRPRE